LQYLSLAIAGAALRVRGPAKQTPGKYYRVRLKKILVSAAGVEPATY